MAKKQTVSFDNHGEINITTGVLEDIAAKAASEVEGVLIQAPKREAGKFFRIQGTGVLAKMRQEAGRILLDISVRIAYGQSVPQVAQAIQEKVKEQILFMTDLVVNEVNVHILSIETEPRNQGDLMKAEEEILTEIGE